MLPTSVDNISRSSSAALPTSQYPNSHEATADDMTIAQGLLSLQNFPPPKIPRRKSSFLGTSPSRHSLDGMDSQTRLLEVPGSGAVRTRSQRALRSSNTWTSSDGEHAAEQDELGDRIIFVQEYNLLAKKHGVRDIGVDELEGFGEEGEQSGKRDSWFSRKILRKTSSTHSVRLKPDRSLRHKRSISDLSLRLKVKKDKLKDKGLQELVLLCGSSRLYLPAEYAASSLSVPTCFRATAQYLVQHGTNTRGVFRIPGSHNMVAALYNHYCSLDEHREAVAGTVRCPTLPDHIRCDVHDVASAFKKFLSGLPGGILGSLALFDAFISIQTQLHGDPELTRTKQSKVRARLIALAISTLRSQYRRDLICAVFGLLCMIGRASETARREDDRGHPLPTSDLMGYGPLGIVLGPLLIGDMLEDYTMRLANPHGGLVLLPISPPKSRKERKKQLVKSGDEGSAFNTHVDKIKVANSITEMLITHWRDVVRHMKNLHSLKKFAISRSLAGRSTKQPFLRPSASESFAIRKPPEWDNMRSHARQIDRSVSPTPVRRSGGIDEASDENILSVRKQRSKPRPKTLGRLSDAKSMSTLSPTKEEIPKDELHHSAAQVATRTVELSSASSSSYGRNNSASPIHRLTRKTGHNDSHLLIKENQPPRNGPLSLYPTIKANPSERIRQQIKIIELRLSPTKDEAQQSPKKLAKSQSHLNMPSKITWAPRSTGSLRKGDLNAAKVSPSNEKSNTALRTKTFRKEIPNSQSSSEKQLRQFGYSQPADFAPTQKSSPEIRLLRATSRDVDEEESRKLRRIAGSEPGFQVSTPTRSERRISRSLYDDPRRKRKLVDVARSTTTDPLSRVSQEEDLASLAALAKALKVGNAEDDDEDEVEVNTASQNDLKPYKRLNQSPSGQLSSIPPGFTKPTGTLNYVPPRPASSPTNRVSTLVAKFNDGDSATDSRAGSPAGSPKKSAVGEARKEVSKPKENLIAPYTMNPSPTRSQVSGKSDKAPRSVRSPVPSPTRTNIDLTRAPPLTATPRRILRGSIHESTPLRPVPKPAGRKESSPVNSSNPFSVSLQPVRKSFGQADISPIKPALRVPRHESAPTQVDGNFSTITGSSSTFASSCSGRPGTHVNDHLQMPAGYHGFRDRLQVGLESSGLEHSDRESPSVPELDGNFNPTTFARLGPSPEIEPRPPQHVHFERPKSPPREDPPRDLADFVHPESPFTETFTYSNPISRLGTPGPGRSNSMLYNQVRNMQRQLSAKNEEIRQLKHQLEARQNLDISTLSEQLREAKRAISIWKTRAEISEKQLHMVTNLPSHSRSRSSLRALSPRSPEQRRRTETEARADEPKVSGRARRSWHGLDGARSTAGWNSDVTTDTVIREIREHAITGSEYSNWVEQTMNALEYMTPDD